MKTNTTAHAILTDPSMLPSAALQADTLTDTQLDAGIRAYGESYDRSIHGVWTGEYFFMESPLSNPDRLVSYNDVNRQYQELQTILNRVYAERDNALNDANAMRTQVQELQNAIPVTEDLLQMIQEYNALCVATTEMWDKHINAFDRTENEAYFQQYDKLASERDLKARWIADSIIFDVEKV